MSARNSVKLLPPDPANPPSTISGPPGVGNIYINTDGTFTIPLPLGGPMIQSLLAAGWSYSVASGTTSVPT